MNCDTLTVRELSQQDVIEHILDLDVAVAQSEDFLYCASGGRLLLGSVPLAHRYGGHQVNFLLHFSFFFSFSFLVLVCFRIFFLLFPSAYK